MRDHKIPALLGSLRSYDEGSMRRPSSIKYVLRTMEAGGATENEIFQVVLAGFTMLAAPYPR
jgi:hypothetical protein